MATRTAFAPARIMGPSGSATPGRILAVLAGIVVAAISSASGRASMGTFRPPLLRAFGAAPDVGAGVEAMQIT